MIFTIICHGNHQKIEHGGEMATLGGSSSLMAHDSYWW